MPAAPYASPCGRRARSPRSRPRCQAGPAASMSPCAKAIARRRDLRADVHLGRQRRAAAPAPCSGGRSRSRPRSHQNSHSAQPMRPAVSASSCASAHSIAADMLARSRGRSARATPPGSAPRYSSDAPLGEREEELRVGAAGLERLGLVEQRAGVLRDRLEHAVAQPPGARRGRDDERLLDQPLEHAEHVVAAVGADRLRGLEREAAGEDREPAEQPLLLPGGAGRSSSRASPASSAGARGRSRAPPRDIASSSRASRASGSSTRARAAASSRASGIPASRRQMAATAAALAPVSAKPARPTAPARGTARRPARPRRPPARRRRRGAAPAAATGYSVSPRTPQRRAARRPGP